MLRSLHPILALSSYKQDVKLPSLEKAGGSRAITTLHHTSYTHSFPSTNVRPPSASCMKNASAAARPCVVKLLPPLASTSSDSVDGRLTSKISSPVPEACFSYYIVGVFGQKQSGDMLVSIMKTINRPPRCRVTHSYLYPSIASRQKPRRLLSVRTVCAGSLLLCLAFPVRAVTGLTEISLNLHSTALVFSDIFLFGPHAAHARTRGWVVASRAA